MSLRLSAALRTSPDFWLKMQIQHDLWQEQQKKQPKIQPFRRTELLVQQPAVSARLTDVVIVWRHAKTDGVVMRRAQITFPGPPTPEKRAVLHSAAHWRSLSSLSYSFLGFGALRSGRFSDFQPTSCARNNEYVQDDRRSPHLSGSCGQCRRRGSLRRPLCDCQAR